MSGGIKPSFVFPTEARAQTRNNNNTSHTWPTQSNAAVPVPPPPTLRQTATSNQIIAPTITSASSRTSVSLSTQPALPRRSASVSSNDGGGAANGSAPLPAPPPPPARRYREMGATPVLLPECLTAATNGQITTAQLRQGSDATQPRRRKSGDAGPQSQTNNHHSSTSMSSGALPSIPAHLQKRSSTVQAASQGRPWQQQPQQRRRSSVNAGSANSSTTAPPPTASASMTASEEPTRVPTGHAARRSVSFIVPDEMARPGLSEFTRTLASATQGTETIADMHRGTVSVQEHQTPQTETVPAPGFATPIIVHRPPTRGNGRVEESNAEQSAGQMPASLAATERRSKASNNNNSSVTASTPQKAEGGLSATLSFRDRVNKGVPPPPRTRLQRRRPGKRRTPQGSLSGSVTSSSSTTTSRTGERRRRGLGHTSTSLLGHGLNAASGLHNEADWQRVHALRVLLYVTWFHTRMMRIVRRARAQQHWQRVLAPRAAFVLQCFWRRVRQRRRVEKLCAVRLLVPWLRLKLTRLRQAKEASARLLQRVFRAERTRVWMRGLYDCMYVHRALRILQRHVRRWEDQKLLRFLRSQREERNLMIERCRHESTRLVRNERAGWLTLLRMAHEQLGFTASDPTAVISHVNGTTTSDKIVNSNDDNVVQPVVVCLASPLHTLETCQAYLTQLFTPESENYLSAYKAGNTPLANATETATTTQEATTIVTHDAVRQISNDDAASSGDGVLDAFVELLGRVEAMERKELERDLLHEHALFCEPVRRISYAIRLRSAVPRLYASLLLSLPTVADMRRAVELFHAEQRARTLIIAEYNAIPLLALHRPGFSATAEQRHRTLLALMSLADANADATHYTPVNIDNEKQADSVAESASLALYDEQQAGQSNTSEETNLLRQMKAAVQANTSDPIPSNDEREEESVTPKPRRLRVMMQPQLTPITTPGAMSPVPLLQMRSQLLQVRRRQRISLSAITDSSAHTSHNEDDDTTYVNVPVESSAEEEVTAVHENNNNRYSEEQHPLPLRSSALTSSNVSEHERKWQAASRSATASDNDNDSVSAMESVGWGAAEVSEQTASKSSTTLNTAVSASVVAPPQPPSPPPRRRHRSQFESAASVVSGPFAAEHDTQ